MNSLDLPEEYRHDIQIIRETADQIIRDFQNDELKITFSGNNFLAFDELKNQLQPFVRNLQKNVSAFNAMLYRVDISENELRNAMRENLKLIDEVVTELIIRREFKKVLTRRYFREK